MNSFFVVLGGAFLSFWLYRKKRTPPDEDITQVLLQTAPKDPATTDQSTNTEPLLPPDTDLEDSSSSETVLLENYLRVDGTYSVNR